MINHNKFLLVPWQSMQHDWPNAFLKGFNNSCILQIIIFETDIKKIKKMLVNIHNLRGDQINSENSMKKVNFEF